MDSPQPGLRGRRWDETELTPSQLLSRVVRLSATENVVLVIGKDVDNTSGFVLLHPHELIDLRRRWRMDCSMELVCRVRMDIN